MARPQSFDPFYIKEKVTVNSKTYGEHTRAARGTIKEAVLNEAMQAASLRMTGSNTPARLIHDALNPFRTNFKGGQFWQKLVRHFAAQAKNRQDYSVTDLELFDINKNYPLANVLNSRSMKVNIDMPALTMELTCNYTLGSRFLKRSSYLDSMQLTVIALFPDFKENDIIVNSVVLPAKKLSDNEPYSFIMNIPAIATSYLLCWKIEGCENGIVTDDSGNSKKAMYLMKAGYL